MLTLQIQQWMLLSQVLKWMTLSALPFLPPLEGPGPWMLMTYKSRKHSTFQPGNVKTSSGSRFSVLTLDDVDSTVDIKQTEYRTILNPLTIPNIARNASLGKGVTIKQVRKINKSRKAPINLTIPCLNLDSLELNPNPHPISTNIPATFGHCPPENATSTSADEIPIFKIPALNIDQDKPSSTDGEPEEASFYDTLDQNLASSTDNLLALSNSSFSNEEEYDYWLIEPPLIPTLVIMDSIIFWNARGAGGDKFSLQFKIY
ncbi:hypothetical protein M0R45_034712 [Rubus argutus]|uniref:Uncharacterized protein n=1 Tax=Rubus argutus TaxID=59490 RepID=A0AAW1VUN1_RUBAR